MYCGGRRLLHQPGKRLASIHSRTPAVKQEAMSHRGGRKDWWDGRNQQPVRCCAGRRRGFVSFLTVSSSSRRGPSTGIHLQTTRRLTHRHSSRAKMLPFRYPLPRCLPPLSGDCRPRVQWTVKRTRWAHERVPPPGARKERGGIRATCALARARLLRRIERRVR